MELELFLLFSIFKFHSYYIIPIWNWSRLIASVCCRLFLITLFLYGIGATIKFSSFYINIIITLFLYGIGAEITQVEHR